MPSGSEMEERIKERLRRQQEEEQRVEKDGQGVTMEIQEPTDLDKFLDRLMPEGAGLEFHTELKSREVGELAVIVSNFAMWEDYKGDTHYVDCLLDLVAKFLLYRVPMGRKRAREVLKLALGSKDKEGMFLDEKAKKMFQGVRP